MRPAIADPTGFNKSYAYGTNSTQQVGLGYATATDLYGHAMPAGFSSTYPNGYQTAVGGQVVGYGTGTTTGNNNNALVWNGPAASAVDLNPSGFKNSFASGTSGAHQVGYGYGAATGSYFHALLWSGSAGSYVDLQSVLPGAFVFSKAYSISGNTVYGYAEDAGGTDYSVTWNVGAGVPEPASLSLIAIAGLGLLRRRRGMERAK